MEPGTTPTPEEQIIAQAQQEVAARRTTRQYQQPGPGAAVVMGFALVALVRWLVTGAA
jgi:hypothetical protein